MGRGIDNKPAGRTLSALAYSAVTSNPAAGRRPGGLFAKLYASDTTYFVLAGVGDTPHGVLRGNCAQGAAGEIETAGIVPVTFGGTVADGDYIEVGASGVAVKATGLRPVAGLCLKGGASGDVGTILLGAKPTGGILGANVASASAIVPTGNVFHLTGTTAVTSITSTGVSAGARIHIIADGASSLTKGNNIKIAASITFAANDSVTLEYDGTNWYEVGKSVA